MLITEAQHLYAGADAAVAVPVREVGVEDAYVRVAGGALNRTPQAHKDVILSNTTTVVVFKTEGADKV